MSVKVSVIVPIYNAAQYLRKCLDSVVGQELKDIEIICVDDGSVDDCAEILTKYDVKAIRQENHGQGYARNRGLEQASGEYVYFIDADDELANEMILKRLVEEMEKARLDVLFFDAETQADDDVDLVAAKVSPKDYIREHDYSGVHTGSELFACFLKHNEYTVCSYLAMFRRAFLLENNIRFPEERYFYEDNIFMTRVMLAAKRSGHRPWRGYVRKVHMGSVVTSKPTLRHLLGYLACYRDASALVNKGGWDRKTRDALSNRRAVYKHYIRRVADVNRDLVLKMKESCSSSEFAELHEILNYPLWEKVLNAGRCLRDRGMAFTLKRIFFGRQP